VGVNHLDRAYLARVVVSGSAGAYTPRTVTSSTEPLDIGAKSTDPSSIASSPAIGAGGIRVMVGYTQGGNGQLLMTDNPPVPSTDPLTFEGDPLTPKVDITVAGEPIVVPASLTGDALTMLLASSTGASGKVYAVNSANGQSHEESAAMGAVESPMWVDYPASGAIGANTVYVVTQDNWLHALTLPGLQERAGWPVRPPVGQMAGPLFTEGNNLYVGSDIGLLVTYKRAPGAFSALTTLDLAAQSTPTLLPGMDLGASVSGHVAGQDVIVATGTDNKLHGVYVQPQPQ
jgi:hypothetical protein